MKTIQKDGYTELVIYVDDLDDFVIDELFLSQIENAQASMAVNLMRFVIMDSQQILKFIRLITEINSLSSSRMAIICNNFVGSILKGILNKNFPVFTDKNDIEIALRQEVASEEKEMLWA